MIVEMGRFRLRPGSWLAVDGRPYNQCACKRKDYSGPNMCRFPPTRDMAADRIHIFDTTLRDGEQAPGFTLNVKEKLAFARALDALGVDIMEAGFPIPLPKDAEAVRRIATGNPAADHRGPSSVP